MSKGMLGMLPLSAVRGPRDTLEANLAGDNGQEWLDALNRFLRKENPWEKSTLLHRLGTTMVPARETTFIARDHFKAGTGKQNKVKISFIGDNFTNWFRKGEGKVEAAAPAHTLAYHELRKGSLDRPVIDELGGEAAAESTLADIWAEMEAQGNGEAGDLLTNSNVNIFYVRDCSGELRVVYVSWSGDGWGVNARLVSLPGGWRAGYRVFACDSVPVAA